MRAFMSDAIARQRSEAANRGAYNDAAAVYEARAILAETTPANTWPAGQDGAGTVPLDVLHATTNAAAAALAESLAAFVADEPPTDPYRIPGTSRPESRPTIRTEGREADGPLFTQDRDARERAEARNQRRMF